MPTLGRSGSSNRGHQEERQVRRKQPARHSLSPQARYAVFKRYGFRCCQCGIVSRDGAKLEVDHRTPVSRGGTNDPANLQTLCRECNRQKGNTTN